MNIVHIMEELQFALDDLSQAESSIDEAERSMDKTVEIVNHFDQLYNGIYIAEARTKDIMEYLNKYQESQKGNQNESN